MDENERCIYSRSFIGMNESIASDMGGAAKERRTSCSHWSGQKILH
ncbi:hypothetical protein KR50_04250 [Jeotgalibacillus campisalis]|uniref:Uncharacterized protein n=1 Tax=Jeotgalibacillus campisalis TaxID=220754 RepID=A0A0C2W938_9BACL|nr:hypothetical protein KR50_04250 [Jeotgalibacillus campisalis]